MKRGTANLDGQDFDLLVCGGGIYGAWTAYDAALRGLKVILVDKGDWASGTSSASSKLIHGGLRYLQSFQLDLVRKSLLEREMLFQTAPHRVRPLRFVIPAYADNPVGKLRLSAGLWLYGRLAGTSGNGAMRSGSDSAGFAAQYPFLKTTELNGGFEYLDGQTDDARFTLEIVNGACQQGSVCRNYCEVVQLLTGKNNKINGARIHDQVSGEFFQIRSKACVIVSGQWIDTILNDTSKRLCRLSKGTHLIMPDLGLKSALLLFSKSDARVFFVIPWYGLTLLGTTDNEYTGSVDDVKAEQSDIDYLLDAANSHFSTVKWRKTDVLGTFAGVRVLKNRGSSRSYLASRDWKLKQLNNGLLVSVGGKFTSARQDAAVIVDRVCRKLSRQMDCQTKWLRFPWAPAAFHEWKNSTKKLASEYGLDQDVIESLIFRHGIRVTEIFELIKQKNVFAKRLFSDLPFIVGDLIFCANHEMVVHLEDLLRRRMPLLIFRRINITELQRIAESVAKELGWDATRTIQEVETVKKKWKIHPL